MPENNEKRLFIALNLPENIKADLAKVVEKFKRKLPDVKWINSEGMHITLQFLGNVNEQEEKKIKESLGHLEGKFEDFIFKLGGLDAFPNIKKPRVIVVKCLQEKHNSAAALQKSIGQEIFIRAGISFDPRPWHPHITLGRMKGRRQALSISADIGESEFNVKTFDLVQAFLKPIGAEYKILEKYNLK